MNENEKQEQLNNLLEQLDNLSRFAKNIKPAIDIEIWQQFHEWRKEHHLPDEADVFVLFLCCGGHPLPVLQEIRDIKAEPTEVARIVSEAHIL